MDIGDNHYGDSLRLTFEDGSGYEIPLTLNQVDTSHEFMVEVFGSELLPSSHGVHPYDWQELKDDLVQILTEYRGNLAYEADFSRSGVDPIQIADIDSLINRTLEML